MSGLNFNTQQLAFLKLIREQFLSIELQCQEGAEKKIFSLLALIVEHFWKMKLLWHNDEATPEMREIYLNFIIFQYAHVHALFVRMTITLLGEEFAENLSKIPDCVTSGAPEVREQIQIIKEIEKVKTLKKDSINKDLKHLIDLTTEFESYLLSLNLELSNFSEDFKTSLKLKLNTAPFFH